MQKDKPSMRQKHHKEAPIIFAANSFYFAAEGGG